MKKGVIYLLLISELFRFMMSWISRSRVDTAMIMNTYMCKVWLHNWSHFIIIYYASNCLCATFLIGYLLCNTTECYKLLTKIIQIWEIPIYRGLLHISCQPLQNQIQTFCHCTMLPLYHPVKFPLD